MKIIPHIDLLPQCAAAASAFLAVAPRYGTWRVERAGSSDNQTETYPREAERAFSKVIPVTDYLAYPIGDGNFPSLCLFFNFPNVCINPLPMRGSGGLGSRLGTVEV